MLQIVYWCMHGWLTSGVCSSERLIYLLYCGGNGLRIEMDPTETTQQSSVITEAIMRNTELWCIHHHQSHRAEWILNQNGSLFYRWLWLGEECVCNQSTCVHVQVHVQVIRFHSRGDRFCWDMRFYESATSHYYSPVLQLHFAEVIHFNHLLRHKPLLGHLFWTAMAHAHLRSDSAILLNI